MQRKNAAGDRSAIRGAIVGWCTAIALLGGAGCGEGSVDLDPEALETAHDGASTDVETPEDPGPPRAEFPHGADITEVTVFWSDLPDGIEPASTLTLVTESHIAEPRTVIPRVLVNGLDDRIAEVELEGIELDPYERAEVLVRLDELPVQGVSHSVTLVATGTYERGNDAAVSVQAEPLAFHFADDYAEAYVYTLDTMVTELHGGRLSDDPRDLRGRVLDAGALLPVAELAARVPTSVDPAFAFEGTPETDVIPPGLESIEYTHEITTTDERLRGVDPALTTSVQPDASGDPPPGPGTEPGTPGPAPWCLIAPWDCCTGDNCLDVCADWSTTYVDASSYGALQKEDHGLGTGTQLVDASYAEFDITKVTCGTQYCFVSTVYSNRQLGPDGCAKLDLPPGSGYSLKVKTRLVHGVSGRVYPVEHHTSNDPAANVGVVVLSKGFTAYGNNTPLPPPMITLPFHQAANAAAAVSRMLASGATVDQPSGFAILSGLGCAPQPGIPATDACAGDTVRTGPYTDPDNSAGSLRWKFVLAHELGHVVQRKAIGHLNNPYCFTPEGVLTKDCEAPNLPDHPQAPASCTCAHVTGSNGLHCLQSLEATSAAQLEGFAQFFAARVWNDADASCLFRYYKQFRTDDGITVQPPFNASCATFANWRDNHCFSPSGGTEYDWLQFLWNLHAVGANKLSMHDIFEVYRGACSDEDCWYETPSWAALEASAAAHFGPGSGKHGKFVMAGDSAGVDSTKF